ncbi:MAG: TolB family protein [Chromatocurvus sp.]
MQEKDALRAVAPRNLTNRPGYDNQPFFTSAGSLLFVQMEGERTDLWQWNPESGTSTRLTATPEQSEFSPTPIPGNGGGISYTRSPTDTSGRLWRMPQAGAAAEIVFSDIGPVGYHAWFDADHVALWLLQDPSVLQLVELDSQQTRTLATGVGRSPQSVPSRLAVSPEGTRLALVAEPAQ